MSLLPILDDPRLAERTSSATRKVLQERVQPAPYQQYLSTEHMSMLRLLVAAILPQSAVGTHVDLAETIDRRLAAGKNPGFRYVVLPPDGEAYGRGLTAFFKVLEATLRKSFQEISASELEEHIRRACEGDLDEQAVFPLSTFMRMVRTDAVRFWMAHPDAMQAIGYFGFADGATGNEGWREIGPNSAAPFERAGELSQQVGAR